MTEQIEQNKRYLQRWQFLDNEFNPWLSLYKNVTDYILPRRGFYADRDGDPSSKAVWNDNIVNDAATRAIRILGAGMQGGLSSENRKWFRLSLMDPEFSAWGPVKSWLDNLEEVCYRLLSGSNYYQVNHMIYEEQGGFGTGCMFLERDDKTRIRFRLSTAGESRFALGADGKVDTIYRKIPMTAKQIAGMFGKDRASSAIKNTIKETPYNYFDVMHVIEPRNDRDFSKKDPVNMPFKSVWFEYSERDRVLRESGFVDLPAVVPTWSKVRNCPYGLGPGHDILGHTLMLQEMEKSSVKGIHRQADPPMAFPAALKDMVSLLPGATNYVDIKDKDRMVGPMYGININLEQVEYKIRAVEEKIERTCYNDLFLLIASRDTAGEAITATEVLERHEEKMILLGPTVERQIDDNLAPTIKWVANVAVEDRLVPPPPEGVTYDQLKVKFIGPLAQAQQLIDAQAINANLSLWERTAMLGEEAMMAVNSTVDWVEVLTKMEEVTSLPSGILRDKDEAQARMEETMAMMQKQAEMQEVAAGVDMAKGLGQASTQEGTALGDLKAATEVL